MTTYSCSLCARILPIECYSMAIRGNIQSRGSIACIECAHYRGIQRRGKRVGVCAYCGNVRVLTREHVIPKCTGQPTDILKVCTWCNNNKGSMSLREWLLTLPSSAPQWIFVPKIMIELAYY